MISLCNFPHILPTPRFIYREIVNGYIIIKFYIYIAVQGYSILESDSLSMKSMKIYLLAISYFNCSLFLHVKFLQSLRVCVCCKYLNGNHVR